MAFRLGNAKFLAKLRFLSVGLVVLVIGGLTYNASQSWHSASSFIEAEAEAWRYIEENDLVATVVPVLSTGSMGPELHGNHLAVVEMIPFKEVRVGQIAVFRQADGGNLIAHTVEHILPDGRLQTRGRANPSFDPLVTEANYVGVVVEKFEFRGPQKWIQPNVS